LTRWPRSTRRKIYLVQLADFMWQEIRTPEERIETARTLPRLPRRRRAQRRAAPAGDASSTAWATAATTASRSSTTTTSRLPLPKLVAERARRSAAWLAEDVLRPCGAAARRQPAAQQGLEADPASKGAPRRAT
jgi:hypothetical protein